MKTMGLPGPGDAAPMAWGRGRAAGRNLVLEAGLDLGPVRVGRLDVAGDVLLPAGLDRLGEVQVEPPVHHRPGVGIAVGAVKG